MCNVYLFLNVGNVQITLAVLPPDISCGQLLCIIITLTLSGTFFHRSICVIGVLVFWLFATTVPISYGVCVYWWIRFIWLGFFMSVLFSVLFSVKDSLKYN